MKTAVIFSGAGLSADSGIQTFRGSDGLWENHKVEDVAEHKSWFKNRELVLSFYEQRVKAYNGHDPHEGHYALAKLHTAYDRVINVTQNVDDLLERAGCQEVVHLHGLLSEKKCEWHKDIPAKRDPRFRCDYVAETGGVPVQMGDLCPKCEGQMRPNVVWFNEKVDLSHEDMTEWGKAVKYNDGVFICVGTSLQVFPAAYLVSFFSQVKNKYIVDPNPKKVSDYVLIEGSAKDKLPELVEGLINA